MSKLKKTNESSESSPAQYSEPWQLQTAKARFSELFRRALTEGPQLVTRQGKEQVIMLRFTQFERLIQRRRQPKSLVKFFADSPLAGVKLHLTRSKDPGRHVKL